MSNDIYKHWKRNLLCIWLGQLLAMAGSSFVLPFIPIFVREKMGIEEESQRAMVVSMFFSVGLLSFCISNPIWGVIGDRFGRKTMLLRAYFGNALTFPALYFMPTVGLLLVMRFISSMFSGTVAASQALVAVTTPDKHQGFALGALSSAFWSGNMLGMVMGGVVVHYFGYMTSFMICGGMFMVGGLLTLFFVDEHFVPPVKAEVAEKKKIHLALPDFSYAVWLVLGLSFLVPMARRCDEPFLALLVELISGKDNAALYTGWVMASASVGGILSGMFFGALADRCKPLTLLLPALICAGAFTMLQATAESLVVLGIARFFIFFAVGGLEPILLSMLSQAVRPERRGAAFGWNASLRVFGGMFGALMGGGVIALAGTRGVFVFAGMLLLIMIVPIVIFVPKISRFIKEKRSNLP